MKLFFFSLSFFCCSLLFAQETKRVLFLGNSYTAYNNLPQLVHSIASSLGDSVYFESRVPGGYTLQGHSSDAASLALIAQGDWDVVVLQEQSQRPSFPLGQVQQDVYPYAQALSDSIRLYNPCTQVLFYMTWGRENGDAMNCPNFPPLCTYEGMQALLRERYLAMANDNAARVSPVGSAWARVRSEDPSIQLYVNDGSHPSYAGSYLAAAVFYTSIFRKESQGASFNGSLASNRALYLRQVADSVVLDSQSLWRLDAQDPQAQAQVRTTGAIVFAQNQSQNAFSYIWDFGDGNQSSDFEPVYQYADTSQTYELLLIASDSCGLYSDTARYSVFWDLASSLQQQETKTWRIGPNPTQGQLFLFDEAADEGEAYRIYNSMGQLLIEQKQGQQGAISLPKMAAGLYIFEYKGQCEPFVLFE